MKGPSLTSAQLASYQTTTNVGIAADIGNNAIKTQAIIRQANNDTEKMAIDVYSNAYTGIQPVNGG